MAKVSVVIPVYRVEKYISETVKSVLQQTFTDFEVLIIDDESPDSSIEICQSFSDPRIKIIHQENRGLSGARNTGIRHSVGEYIAFLDSDDVWLPEKLEKHLRHLESSPEVGLSFCRSAFIDESGQFLGTYQMPQLKDIETAYLLCRNPVGNGSAPVIRKSVLEEIKFFNDHRGSMEDYYFDEQFRQSEDIECWIRISILTNWKIEGIPDVLTLYRVNSGGLSANYFKQLDSWENVIKKTRSYAPDLIAKWENKARAYQLRYLARRAVRSQDGAMAIRLFNRAIATHWQITFEEPRRTILTGLAAYLLWLLPRPFYQGMERWAMRRAGVNQARRISREQSQESSSRA
ncbi:glucosyl transferase [Neosynechococcus sphagnicola sy1]|uniref:Glucosyl transferase n=1 Tax=Neosynechococcus sphagnicola sy1 TaxID=1497020 RepID=A0A098TK40_9CYAN|nr:glycosyltransferase family 2 protein [Neosynechococcus sphagnicola]KGF72700.1 glucosyl transferase [Neosynechococcus sphagnicola sy1]